MAISAVAITTTDTLETFRVEFNNLVADVASVEQVGASNIIIADGGNIGSASDQDALSIASTGVVTFSQAPSFTTGLSVSDLDIDGGTDIGAAIVDADLFIIDDGASGTNRKTAASRLLTYAMTGTLTAAAQTGITSVGTLTALQVDNVNINGNTISASSGAVNITPAGVILTAPEEAEMVLPFMFTLSTCKAVSVPTEVIPVCAAAVKVPVIA